VDTGSRELCDTDASLGGPEPARLSSRIADHEPDRENEDDRGGHEDDEVEGPWARARLTGSWAGETSMRPPREHAMAALAHVTCGQDRGFGSKLGVRGGFRNLVAAARAPADRLLHRYGASRPFLRDAYLFTPVVDETVPSHSQAGDPP
jgi:hypothetical protein